MRYSVLFLSVAAFALCSSVSAHEGHDHSHVHEESAAVVDEAGADDKLPVLTQFKVSPANSGCDGWMDGWMEERMRYDTIRCDAMLRDFIVNFLQIPIHP